MAKLIFKPSSKIYVPTTSDHNAGDSYVLEQSVQIMRSRLHYRSPPGNRYRRFFKNSQLYELAFKACILVCHLWDWDLDMRVVISNQCGQELSVHELCTVMLTRAMRMLCSTGRAQVNESQPQIHILTLLVVAPEILVGSMQLLLLTQIR